MILKEERDERLKRVLNVGDLAKTVFAVHLLLLLLLLFLHSDNSCFTCRALSRPLKWLVNGNKCIMYSCIYIKLSFYFFSSSSVNP